jgi:dTDP-4-amino-4,6-dideoxygalactose transaminase
VIVPLVDLKTQAVTLRAEFETVIWSIVERGAYTMGPELIEFERLFAAFCGTAFCVGVSSGTDAVKLALLCAGVGPGDEVIVPVNTFIATAEAVSHIGATPVFVDCRADTANIDPELIESRLTARTRAIVPVHLYGQPADMEPITALAGKHGLAVVEDACQAHGATWRGHRVGTLGVAAAFSFYPGKNLGALGDGGAVTTSDEAVAQRLLLYRNHGAVDKHTHAVVGYCDRLHNLQAGLLTVKLAHLAQWNSARRAAARVYDELLEGIDGVVPVRVGDGVESVYHLYVVKVRRRDDVVASLKSDGIEAGVHYARPLHLQPAYAHLGHGEGDFPAAERLTRHVVSLPIFPEITRDQQEYVVTRLRAAVSGKAGVR